MKYFLMDMLLLRLLPHLSYSNLSQGNIITSLSLNRLQPANRKILSHPTIHQSRRMTKLQLVGAKDSSSLGTSFSK
uniref:Putative secreted protein n=1 Tax=Panstrongylus lignarius TaxID=156445 RepID=A0A224Y3U8_9HEMI